MPWLYFSRSPSFFLFIFHYFFVQFNIIRVSSSCLLSHKWEKLFGKLAIGYALPEIQFNLFTESEYGKCKVMPLRSIRVYFFFFFFLSFYLSLYLSIHSLLLWCREPIIIMVYAFWSLFFKSYLQQHQHFAAIWRERFKFNYLCMICASRWIYDFTSIYLANLM